MRNFRMYPAQFLLVILVGLSLSTFVEASIGSPQQEVPSSRNHGDDMTLDQLHEAATSAHAVTRIDAIRRIATDANPASLQILVHALEDSDPSVREIATIGLARLGRPESVPALVGAMYDENPAVRSQAAVAIANIEPSEAVVRGFLAGLDDHRPPLKAVGSKGRQSITYSASGRRTGSANGQHENLGQSSLVITKKVLRHLVTAKPATAEILIASLTDANRVKRYTTAYALSTSTDPQVVAALENALVERDTAVVSGAYEFYLADLMTEAKAILLRGLNEFDDPDLILAMSRCGDSELESAAALVAREKGVRLGH